jgi:hypothetical protein
VDVPGHHGRRAHAEGAKRTFLLVVRISAYKHTYLATTYYPPATSSTKNHAAVLLAGRLIPLHSVRCQSPPQTPPPIAITAI